MRPFGDDHYDGTGWVPQQAPALALRQALADQYMAPQDDEGSLRLAHSDAVYDERIK